jgi:outer membrane biosynthesis protein TonB
MGAVLAAAIGVGAAGCDTLDSFDMDFLNTKKKLPGDRKPVFPEGVPGVTQGVPAEYIKGYDEKAAQQTPDAATAAAQQIAADKEAKPKPAAKPKPKPKPVTQRTQPTQPAQAQPAPQQSGTWPQSQSQPQASWPAAPNPNQFSR